ncbi:hypothetical protein PHMEG_00012165 [Phytophthora megakarya]|uniref:Uncharacterized protein n=1 Tax=Phytophthora megakarya TaxID=4795 RepID=A0A225WB51_9STRA|nr:hypothetical protein PHMEG_00012165 [Phytophthora megakarya]
MIFYCMNPNSLVFMGPIHAGELQPFCYVWVHRVEGYHATVRAVGPSSGADGLEFIIPCSSLDMRMIDVSESIRCSGCYLAHPIHPGRPSADQREYDFVVRYVINTDGS